MLDVIETLQTSLRLRVSAVEDVSLLLTFTHVDSSDPEAEFKLTIESENGRYRGMSLPFHFGAPVLI